MIITYIVTVQEPNKELQILGKFKSISAANRYIKMVQPNYSNDLSIEVIKHGKSKYGEL